MAAKADELLGAARPLPFINFYSRETGGIEMGKKKRKRNRNGEHDSRFIKLMTMGDLLERARTTFHDRAQVDRSFTMAEAAGIAASYVVAHNNRVLSKVLRHDEYSKISS